MGLILLLSPPDEHFDPTVPLPAFLGRFRALQLRLAERARRDLVRRDTRAQQGGLDRVHAPLAEGLVVLVGAARVRVAIQTDLDVGVLLHVLVQLGDLAGLRAPDRAAIEVEKKVSERHPGSLRAGLALHALGATHALRATWALDARHPRRPRLTLGSLRAR